MYLCSRMIADFVRYLEAERRYSPLTVRNYRHDVMLIKPFGNGFVLSFS